VTSAFAQAQIDTPLTGGLMDYVKLMLVLGGVLVFAIVTLRVWLPRLRVGRPGPGGPLEIFATLPVEPRKTLYVVRAGSAVLLMGTSDSGMQFMTALNPADFESTPEPAANPTRFAELLRLPKSGGKGRS
jgi:hypothetical protein